MFFVTDRSIQDCEDRGAPISAVLAGGSKNVLEIGASWNWKISNGILEAGHKLTVVDPIYGMSPKLDGTIVDPQGQKYFTNRIPGVTVDSYAYHFETEKDRFWNKQMGEEVIADWEQRNRDLPRGVEVYTDKIIWPAKFNDFRLSEMQGKFDAILDFWGPGNYEIGADTVHQKPVYGLEQKMFLFDFYSKLAANSLSRILIHPLVPYPMELRRYAYNNNCLLRAE